MKCSPFNFLCEKVRPVMLWKKYDISMLCIYKFNKVNILFNYFFHILEILAYFNNSLENINNTITNIEY